jgi:hypothetical protein
VTCTPAPVGFYVPGAGATGATPCPAGTTSTVGASSCQTGLAAQGCSLPAVAAQAFSGDLTSFADANPNAKSTDFTTGPGSVVIDWGDGSHSPGSVTGPTGGLFTVSGSHTYRGTGYFSVIVSVSDAGGSAISIPCSKMLVFALAPGGGAFVIGDKESAINTAVTFWGAQWAKQNATSSGSSSDSFKGFALSPATPACGAAWSTDPGNSTPPPSGPLPAYMGIIVTSSYGQSGSAIAGNTTGIVVVKTESGYQPNPGHNGTGTVVAKVC